jgi:hypothetical protein
MRPLVLGLVRHWRSRARVLAVALGVAVVGHALRPRPPVPTREGLAAWLGARVGGTVAGKELGWEPSRGALGDFLLGRGLWFLATPEHETARDLFRASVRLLPNGQPLTLSTAANLSSTPDADEAGLIVDEQRVLVATLGRGRVCCVTALEQSSGAGLLARLVARATTGLWAPLARTDVIFDAPVGAVAAKLDGQVLTLELSGDPHGVKVDLERGTLTRDSRGVAHVVTRVVGADSGRVGVTGLGRAWFGPRVTTLGGQGVLSVLAAARRALGAGTGGAPPKRPGDIAWRPVRSALMKTPLGVDPAATGERAPYFERATLAAGGPGSIELVAIDLEQLELGVQAGSEWPRASFGAPGEGRLPIDPERRRRVVAVLNAGPEAAYDRYGTMADGRLLVAPEPGWPSVVVTRSGRVTLGAWTFRGELPADVLGFTERRTALVQAGAPVATSDRSVRRRSALCAVAPNRLLYAYADAADPETLARGLVAAGCDTALPLAASPERLGFALVDAGPGGARFEFLDPRFDFDAAATLTGGARDFFYLSVRDVRPKAPPDMPWHPDSGAQPEPAWLPGILGGELTLGGATLSLTSFETRRSDFRVRPGPLEPGAKGQPWSGALAPAERARALASLELGHATGAARYGLALGTLIPLPLKPSYATLVLGDGEARILLPGEPVTLRAEEQAVQLPLLADDADVTARARERGDARQRAALGVTDDGRVVVATLRHDSSDPLAVGLRAAGCRRIVELDRGSHHPAVLERSGTEKAPREAPESSTLWVLSRARR